MHGCEKVKQEKSRPHFGKAQRRCRKYKLKRRAGFTKKSYDKANFNENIKCHYHCVLPQPFFMLDC